MPVRETEPDVRVRNEQGRKRPFSEFYADAKAAGLSERQMADEIHESRSHRARVADRSFKAVRYITGPDFHGENPKALIREYYNNPNRVDVAGVDSVAKEYKERRIQRVADAFLEGGVVDSIDTKAEDLEGAAGRYEQGDRRVAVTPQAGSSTLAHELGHALDYQLSRRPVFSEGHRRWYGLSADIVGEEAGITTKEDIRKSEGPPRVPGQDQPFHQDIHDASSERRGQIREENDYRTEPTEKFADWFALAIENPRHTRATRGSPWAPLEEQVNEKADLRIRRAKKAIQSKARKGVIGSLDEALHNVELDWSHRDERWEQLDDYRREAKETVDERLDELWTDEVDEEVAALRGERFTATRPEDFGDQPAADQDELTEPFYRRHSLEELIPTEPLERYGDVAGVEVSKPSF